MKIQITVSLSFAMVVLVVVAASQETPRGKRGAAVYKTFPTGGPSSSHPHRNFIENHPDTFVASLGAGPSSYGGGSGSGGGNYGATLLQQYQQYRGNTGVGVTSYPSGSSGSGSGGSSYGGRKRRSPQPQQRHNYYYGAHASDIYLNPYYTQYSTGDHLFQQASNQYGASIPYSPNKNQVEYSTYNAHAPNQFSVAGLLHSTTSTNDAHNEVFKAFTANTPLFANANNRGSSSSSSPAFQLEDVVDVF